MQRARWVYKPEQVIKSLQVAGGAKPERCHAAAPLHSAQCPMIPVTESSKGISFSIRIHPRARKNAITGVIGDALKLALTAPPVEGRANQAVIEFFAELFEIPRSSVTITSGETSRNKKVRIAGLTRAAIVARLSECLDST
jgi:hypothetical protein